MSNEKQEAKKTNFTSDGGFKVIRYETTSIGETLVGSIVRQTPSTRRSSQATSLSIRI